MPHRFSTKSIADAWPFAAPPRRAVFKCGSNLLSTAHGTLDEQRIAALAADVAAIHAAGTQIIIVSSGAVAAGMGDVGEAIRPQQLPRLQGLAAIGQCRLMTAWRESFAPHAMHVAQVLLTRDDLEDRRRYLNFQYTLDALLAMNAIPVINENDTVITEELSVGDNDMLSAITAAKMSADLLVILTDIDGLYTAHPSKDESARLIPVVEEFTAELEALGQGPGSKVGRGGMHTKVAAAKHATHYGVATVIANGRSPGIVREVFSGDFTGTLFLPSVKGRSRGSARGHWISMRRPKGSVVIDDGARRALLENGKSLLPVGVVEVRGTFAHGDTIAIVDAQGTEIARGLASFSSADTDLIKGMKAACIADVLGTEPQYDEIVHRDNLELR